MASVLYYECDLCGEKAQEVREDEAPVGWTHLMTYDPPPPNPPKDDDEGARRHRRIRTVTSRDICGACTGRVLALATVRR